MFVNTHASCVGYCWIQSKCLLTYMKCKETAFVRTSVRYNIGYYHWLYKFIHVHLSSNLSCL